MEANQSTAQTINNCKEMSSAVRITVPSETKIRVERSKQAPPSPPTRPALATPAGMPRRPKAGERRGRDPRLPPASSRSSHAPPGTREFQSYLGPLISPPFKFRLFLWHQKGRKKERMKERKTHLNSSSERLNLILMTCAH